MTTVAVPAMDLEAERAALGGVLLGGVEVLRGLAIPGSAFYLDRHRAIYSAMRRLAERGDPVDLLTVKAELARAAELDMAGGPATLAQLVEEGSIAVNVPTYARIIAELAQKREYVALGQRLTNANGAAPATMAEMVREAETRIREMAPRAVDPIPSAYIQTAAAFIAEDDPPLEFIIPEILPWYVIMLLHGDPRARKSLAAFEIALAAATGTAAFGLPRLTPSESVAVLYVQEEDPRSLTRPRVRAQIKARCHEACPETLHVAVRRGVDLDDPLWVDQLVTDLKRLDAKLLVLDAARRLSAKTDEGPAKVRELTRVLRHIVTQAGVSIVIVHHDVKPPSNGQDQRRRSQRASGGDWFAACECPVHVEKIGARESLVFPEDYKFTADPAPFTFTCHVEGGLITRLVGTDTDLEQAERAGIRGKVFDWLRANGPASKTAMQKAGIARWETLEPVIEGLCKEGKIDAAPGRQKNSFRYFVPQSSSPSPEDSR